MSILRSLLSLAAALAVVAFVAGCSDTHSSEGSGEATDTTKVADAGSGGRGCCGARATEPVAAKSPDAPSGKATAAAGTAPDLEPQTTCPVMGGAIDKTIYADYQGRRVYFCCRGCIAAFKKDPDKYLKKL